MTGVPALSCIEPMNNLSEQVIRKHVLMRKIIGAFRSENGAEYYPALRSSLRSDYKEKRSTMNSKNYSSMSFV